MHDAFPTFADERDLSKPGPIPARASLMALFGRLGAPVARRESRDEDPEPLAQAFELDVLGPQEPAEIGRPALASRAENRRRRLREDAKAAYASVVGPHEAALDAALAVIEAEWRSTAAERGRFAEALKSIRLYAGDADSRQRARRALEPGVYAQVGPGATAAPCACRGRDNG